MGELSEDLKSISKFVSFVLRHSPESIGLSLNSAGWVDVELLLRQACAHGMRIDRSILEKIVATSDKRRFAISDDGLMIRANQGHSVEVDLGLEALKPPAQLFHGTASRFVPAIAEQGLKPQSRQHVHLSTEITTALAVGRRHGSPIVLRVDSAKMYELGHSFFQSQNGIWLTLAVPSKFVHVIDLSKSSDDACNIPCD